MLEESLSHYFFFFFTLGIFLLFPQRREGERNSESATALSAGEY
jgi:hypothetical protein